MRLKSAAAYVLTLERAVDRRANVVHQISKLAEPVPLKFWNGIDSKTLDLSTWPTELDAGAPIFSSHTKRAGAIAFCLSYVGMLQHIADRGFPWTLILEDDFELVRPERGISTFDVIDGAEIVSLDTRMNRRGLGTIGTLWSQPAISKLLASFPMRDSIDVWIYRNCYGFMASKEWPMDETRTLRIDTVSFDDRDKRIRPSAYQAPGITGAIFERSYL